MIEQKDKIKLFETLIILYKCHSSVNTIWKKLDQNKEIIKGLSYSDSPLLYHIILEVVNFQEEYKNFNCIHLKPYKERINEIRNINKSIFKKINEWDLQSFRNNIVAHPWRKSGQFVIPDSLDYKIPRNAFEFQLLVNYLNYVWKMISSEFSNEFEETINHMLSIKIESKPKADYRKINEEQLNLVDEVNRKCKDLNKDYFLQVYLYDIDN
ncbi:hypothetical protein [Autumnicola psychrophila]|uniref:HEPN AbiU2-like domain-containing protein n=1 Tax=Autumnicola psychrophila TaxID=3075592 RepID=A0ABU3DN49_9FLAO|nr:hypothetical protein [Zunongwangia sp. F225]MDT0685148.1 hypothetical protein [Zunongwangia sp. F225]